MGARRPRHEADLDSPRRKVRVAAFRLAATTVTNALFARFIAETGYVTTAERIGTSYVFYRHLTRPERFPAPSPLTPWWRDVPGAAWCAPAGPGSDLAGLEDHPVTHVSWEDATAFCTATGHRLPEEAEWECAARGGLVGKKYPWGSAPDVDDPPRHNVWQDTFPTGGGAGGLVSATAFAPNQLGFYNMTGNVWEWCATHWGPLPRMGENSERRGGDAYVQRGGSYLCHASYCERYYVHSRISNSAGTTTGHTGFRVAADPS